MPFDPTPRSWRERPAAVKVAAKLWSEPIVTLQVPVPLQPPPEQPVI
jgi:hypothetical protein